jgi:hypothetical protein
VCDRYRILRHDRAPRLSRLYPAIPFLLLLAIADGALGLPFEQTGSGTYYVLAGLLLGKPLAFCCSRTSRGSPVQGSLQDFGSATCWSWA